MKTCKCCNIEKPFSNFYKAKTCVDGYRGDCKECFQSKRKPYYEANRESAKERTKEWSKNNKQRKAETDKIYYQNNKEKIQEYKHRWYRENKQHKKEYDKEYRKVNQYKYNENKARYKAKLKKASPKWLTDAHKEEMKFYYWYAKFCQDEINEKCSVDHIIPIQSDIVCGLHVPWNLQIMTQSENSSKGNRF